MIKGQSQREIECYTVGFEDEGKDHETRQAGNF